MSSFLPRSVSAAAAALLVGACLAAPASAQQKTSLVFSAGPTGGTWTPMAAATGALSLAGDFFARYAIAKAGIHVPLMPAAVSEAPR